MSWFQISASPTPRILVVGDAMVDCYISGDVSRISPEAPVPVLLVSSETNKPGGAANVAANVAAMGASARLLCIAGADEGRAQLAAMLESYGVSAELVTDDLLRTTRKIRIVSGQQQIVRIDREAAPSADATAALSAALANAATAVDFVVFSDYAKGALNDLPRLLQTARDAGLRTLVDPKRADPTHYRGTFVLKPNENEFQAMFGPCRPEELGARALEALRTYDIGHMVVTRGAKGMLIVSANGAIATHEAHALEVFDVSGAGDTVAAALAVALAAGHSISQAAQFANRAAAVAVAHFGTYVVTDRDMESSLATEIEGGGKVRTRAAMVDVLSGARAKGSRIVFTNGCFDVLHPGHVRMLAAARKQGDLLVVGLNSDESTRRLKGPSRPVNPFEDRAEVLAGLAAVDFVVGFEEDTPYALIEALQPDVLVKGGDYARDAIVGADLVAARGGRVVIVDFHAGHSTTQTIEQINRTNEAIRSTD